MNHTVKLSICNFTERFAMHSITQLAKVGTIRLIGETDLKEQFKHRDFISLSNSAFVVTRLFEKDGEWHADIETCSTIQAGELIDNILTHPLYKESELWSVEFKPRSFCYGAVCKTITIDAYLTSNPTSLKKEMFNS